MERPQFHTWYYANADPAQVSNVEDRLLKHDMGDGGICDYIAQTGSQGSPGDWAAHNGPPNYAYCYYNSLWVLHSPWYQPATAYNPNRFSALYKPGNTYRAYANGGRTTLNKTPNPLGTFFKLGYYDGANLIQSGSQADITAGPAALDYIFTLKPTAANLLPTIISDSLMVYDYKLEMLPTFYRVTSKMVSDGQGHQYEYTYAYEGAAMNDSAHSNWVDTTKPLVKKYSEFRGHSQVTELAPGGRTTVTSFEQGDILKGRATQVDVKDGSGDVFNRSITTYDPQQITSGTVYGTDQFIYWIKTTSQEDRQYNGDADYAGVKQSYSYDSYGNQTEALTSAWDGSGWTDYRKQVTLFYPNTTAWLVGLPAGGELYSCQAEAAPRWRRPVTTCMTVTQPTTPPRRQAC